MALTARSKTVSIAKGLINSGKVEKTAAWSFSAADGNTLLGPKGDDWTAYANAHLAEDTSAPENTKARYKYPVIKGGKVYRSGVIAAKSRAAQQKDTSVETAAAGLLDLIDKKDHADGSAVMYAHEHVANVTGHSVENLQAAPAGAYIQQNGSTWTKAAEGTYWQKTKGSVEEDDDQELPQIMIPGQVFNSNAVDPDEPDEKNQMPGECDCGTTTGVHDASCASLRTVVQDRQDRAQGGLKAQYRIDVMDTDWMTYPFTETPEGFLSGRAVVTNIGVFTYRNKDGTVQAELRLPEEVFDRDSLWSLKLKPVCNDHPPVNVTPENIKQYQVGNTGNNPNSQALKTYGDNDADDMADGLHVAIDMTIQEAKAIADVKAGKTALSCGYTCDLEPAPAGSKYLGMQYDFIQRNIRYNHVAIVDAARAGDEAKIRLDSADATLGFQVMGKKINKEEPMLKKVNLDGVDYEAEAKVIETLTQTKTRADAADAKVTELTTQVSSLSAERDTHKDRADALAKEVETLKADSVDEVKLDALVASKLALRETAKSLGVEKVDGVSDLDLKKAVILKVTPSAKLDGKDATYIQSRFDASLEIVADSANAGVRALGAGPLPGPAEDHKDADDPNLSPSERARLRHHQDQADRWKTNSTDKGGK